MYALSPSLPLFFFLLTFSIDAARNKLPKGFSIDLIHRDSPLSPFYNSSMTHSERLHNAALRSISRAHRFRQSLAGLAAETDIIPNVASYLMKISIGNPPVKRWAIADTGSDLIWFQCSPCPPLACYSQDVPLFNPTQSSTYMPESCGSRNCELLPEGRRRCGSSGECVYYYSYGDNSYTVGDLATDSINFGTSDGQSVSFPMSVFGCGHNNRGTFNSHVAGLVGLGNGPLSLVSQLGYQIGRKFSYCLPPFDEMHSTTKLRFGEEATISGNGVVSTPLFNKPSPQSTFYYLNLEGITVGQETVQTGQSNGNIVIDSGTTLTFLPSEMYDQVEALVKKAIAADQSIVQNPSYKLCYTNVNSIQNFPNFMVHFTGADLSLKPRNFFRPVDNNVICFAMLPANSNGLSLYGNVAQIDFNVEHDLDQKKVSFAPVDHCTT